MNAYRAESPPVNWDDYYLSHEQLRRLGEETPTYLYDGLIHSEITNVVAKREVGKSSLALHLANCFLSGEPFLGRHCTITPRRVVLVMSEAYGEWARRVLEHTPNSFPGERVMDSYRYPFGRGGDLWSLADRVTPQKGDLVILDSLTGVCGDLLDPAEVKAVYTPLKEWASAGAAVVVLAHAKDGDHRASRATGISQIGFDARRTVSLSKTTGGRLTLHAEGNDGEVVDLTLERGEHVADFRVTKDRTDSGQTKRQNRGEETLERNRQIAEFIVDHCQGKSLRATAKEVAEKFGGAQGTAQTNLSKKRAYGAMVQQDQESASWALVSDDPYQAA